MNRSSMGKRMLFMFGVIIPIPVIIYSIILLSLSFSQTKSLCLSQLKDHSNAALADLEETIMIKKKHLKITAKIISQLEEKLVKNPKYLNILLKNIADQTNTHLILVNSKTIPFSSHPMNEKISSIIKKSNFLSLKEIFHSSDPLIYTFKSDSKSANSYVLIAQSVTCYKASCKTAVLVSIDPLPSLLSINHKAIQSTNMPSIEGPIFLNSQGKILYSPENQHITSSFIPYAEKGTHSIDDSQEAYLYPYADKQGFYSFSLSGKHYCAFLSQSSSFNSPRVLTFVKRKTFLINALQSCSTSLTIYSMVLLIGSISMIILCLFLSKAFKGIQDQITRLKEGDITARCHPQKLGYELNLLGNAFNHSLILLLKTMKEAEAEHIKKAAIQKEWDLIAPLRKKLLLSFDDTSLNLLHNGLNKPIGLFLSSYASTERTLIGIGLCQDQDLASCLYAISFRNIFLSCASLEQPLDQLLSNINTVIHNDPILSKIPLPLLLGVYNKKEKTLSITAPSSFLIFIKKPDKKAFLISSVNNISSDLSENYQITTFSKTDHLIIISGIDHSHKNPLLFLSEKTISYLEEHPIRALDMMEKELQALANNRLKTPLGIIFIKPQL